MKSYIIKRVENREALKSAEHVEINIPYFDTPDGITASAAVCRNEEELLVHLVTVEKNYRAIESGKLGSPCDDSCLEFFFSPVENDKRYFNIEYNSNGCMYLGFGEGLGKFVRIIHEGDEAEKTFAPEIVKREDGWEISYRVPFYFIKRFFPAFNADSGTKIRANLYKCADFSEPPHYLSWNAVEGEPFSFHRPECFGCMMFE